MVNQWIKQLSLVALLGCTACGETNDTPSPFEHLPQAPQLLPNPEPVVFEVVSAGSTAQIDVVLLNGGRDDLTFTTIELDDDSGAFDIANTSGMTAAALESVVVTLEFSPQARGMHLATLRLESNAENSPSATIAIFGPAASAPRLDKPDIIAFEDPARLVPEAGFAFVRLFNVGQSSAALAGYEVTEGDDVFSLPAGSADPSIEAPIALVGGGFVIVSLAYTGTGAGPHTGTFTLTYYDYAAVTSAGPPTYKRIVPEEAIQTLEVGLTSEQL